MSLGDDGIPGIVSTRSSLNLHPGEIVLGFSGEGHRFASLLAFQATSGSRHSPDEATFLAYRSYLAAGLGHGLDISLVMPFFYESFSGDSVGFSRGRGQGDLSVGLKAVLPWKTRNASFSLLASGSIPTASTAGTFPREIIHHPPDRKYPSGSTLPFGTSDVRLGGGAGATVTLERQGWKPFHLHLNFTGERVMAPASSLSLGVARFSLAAEAPVGQDWRVEAHFLREEIVIEPLVWTADMGEAVVFSLGLSWSPRDWLSVRAGGHYGPESLNPTVAFSGPDALVTYRGASPAAAYLALAMHGFPLRWDRDRDGVPDSRDRCPRRAEDMDGFEDEDGCPEIDNDRDGILDNMDRCPLAPEDRDGFKDWDGCPDLDNDMDGVDDAGDACRNEAEDKDGVNDHDGCPDMDDDRDGIPDAADRCPKAGENRNGFEDGDGCPEADSDRDGMPDKIDRCPQEAELVNFFQDEDGCPDVKPEPVRNGVLAGVAFLAGNAEFLPSSFPPLDSLARLLTLYPGTEIEIQGHLDDRSGSGAFALSQDRAKAVVTYLAGKGIEPRRMKYAGYGSSLPIASNRTAMGRETNRRIEIRRLN